MSKLIIAGFAFLAAAIIPIGVSSLFSFPSIKLPGAASALKMETKTSHGQ